MSVPARDIGMRWKTADRPGPRLSFSSSNTFHLRRQSSSTDQRSTRAGNAEHEADAR